MNKLQKILVVAAVLALAGCSSVKTDVTGTISILGALAYKGETNQAKAGDPCFFPKDGNLYPEIESGAQVKLGNDSGTVLALGTLGTGGLRLGWSENGERKFASSDKFMKDECVYEFTLSPVELKDEFHFIEVANSGEVLFSREDLLAGVSLTLGDK